MLHFKKPPFLHIGIYRNRYMVYVCMYIYMYMVYDNLSRYIPSYLSKSPIKSRLYSIMNDWIFINYPVSTINPAPFLVHTATWAVASVDPSVIPLNPGWFFCGLPPLGSHWTMIIPNISLRIKRWCYKFTNQKVAVFELLTGFFQGGRCIKFPYN